MIRFTANSPAAAPVSRTFRDVALAGAAAMMMLGAAAGAASASAPSAGRAAHARTAATTAPTAKALLPLGMPGGQASFKPSAAQIKNAKAIVKAGREMKLSPRAEVLAIACSLQESKLINLGNLGHRNDHDSLGLFQQRPSAGWGSPTQLTNPDYAAKAFYKALKSVSHFENRPLTEAVQRVQVSAFPSAYAKWEKMASNLVLASYGTGPYSGIAATK